MYNLLLVKLNKTGDITMNQRDFLSHNQVVSLIKAVGDKRTVLIMGENGIGKTSVHRTLCADPDFSTHFKVPPIDCTQLSDGSLFMPDIDRERGVSRELPNERLGISFNNQRGSMNQQPVMLFFDEVAKVPQFVKNMIAPVAYERRAGSMFMPDKSVVIMATNLAMEGLGDYLEAHLRNRIIVVYMRKPSLDEFMNDFAIPNKLNPILLACLEEHPEAFDSFIDYLPGGKYAGKDQSKDNPIIYNPSESQDAYATPRSFHAASDILDGMDRLDGATLEQALNGAINMGSTLPAPADQRCKRRHNEPSKVQHVVWCNYDGCERFARWSAHSRHKRQRHLLWCGVCYASVTQAVALRPASRGYTHCAAPLYRVHRLGQEVSQRVKHRNGLRGQCSH
jgi:hypothetical protein